jgi:ADP-heptose:LPS heptosyltransferase
VIAARAIRQPARVVALRALGLGDLLTAVPALRALAAGIPGSRLTLVTPSPFAPLVALAEPEAGRIDVVGADGLRSLPAPALAAGLAVNLHGRGPQSHRLLLGAEARRLHAFRHPGVRQSAGGPEWDAAEHEVERWCRLVAALGIEADPARLGLRPPPGCEDHPLAGATVIHPGAADPARRWPASRFGAVARAERAAGRRVVVTGAAAEAGLAGRVARAAGVDADDVLAGRTTLLELAAVVAAAGRLVCGDTGVAHLATAFGTPSVLLFGPTPPDQWGPPRDPLARERHRVLWAGRRGDPHGSEPDSGLLEITVEDVTDAMGALPRELRPETSRRLETSNIGVSVA